MEFFTDDEQALIITQAKNDPVAVINIWNLFHDSYDDSIYSNNNVVKRVPDNNRLFPSKDIEYSHLTRNSKDILRIYGDGSVVNILEHEDFKKACEIDDPVSPEKLLKIYSIDSEKNYLQKSSWRTSVGSKNHKIYKFSELLVDNQEPWMDNNSYQRISAFLGKNNAFQLIIGSTTVQIWKKQRNETILEYIWTMNDDDDIHNNKHNDNINNIEVQNLYIGEGQFLLEVKWGEGKSLKKATIKWPYPDHHVTPIKHACEALEHLNKRKNMLVGYERQYKFEKMTEFITKIIWRFVENKPEMWRLMEVRYDVMSHLVKGGANSLIKFILFGKEEISNNNDEEKKCSHDFKRKLHVPMTEKWKIMSSIIENYDDSSNDDNSDINGVVNNITNGNCHTQNSREKTVLELAI